MFWLIIQVHVRPAGVAMVRLITIPGVQRQVTPFVNSALISRQLLQFPEAVYNWLIVGILREK